MATLTFTHLVDSKGRPQASEGSGRNCYKETQWFRTDGWAQLSSALLYREAQASRWVQGHDADHENEVPV